MSEPENFLSRWSRRKQDADHAVEEPSVAPASKIEPAAPAEIPAAASGEKKEPEFDVSTLPPIDSIDVGTDIRVFLQKGVPLDLTRAALRRAWTADPAIRDFIEVAENQWDFATGSDIPGFGPLEASDDIRRMVAEVFDGKEPVEKLADAISEPPLPNSVQNAAASSNSELIAVQSAPLDSEQQKLLQQESSHDRENVLHREEENIATQQDEENSESDLPIKRAHGGALPQ
jgi:hypothetical protein